MTTQIIFLFSLHSFAALTLVTDRKADHTDQIKTAFEAQNPGETLNVDFMASKELVDAINSQSLTADVVLTKDMYYMNSISSQMAPMQQALLNMVPPFARSQNYIGVAYRVRTVIFDSNEFSADDFSTYEDLADSSKWSNALCMRTSGSTYSIGLGGYLVRHLGKDQATQVASGWKENLAAPVFSSDRAMIDAIVNGTCAAAVINNYYLAAKINSDGTIISDNVGIAFLKAQSGTGTHTNGYTAGVLASSSNKPAAFQLVKLMLSNQIQGHFSRVSNHFPVVNTATNVPGLVRNWMNLNLQTDMTSWSQLGPASNEAEDMFSSIGFQ